MVTDSTSPPDQVYLVRFIEQHDEEAFQCLVIRYLGMLRAAAQRRCGDSDVAEEAVQNAFTTLARKASTLTKHPTLSGWLHKTVSLEAAHLARAQRIRSEKMNHYQAHQETTLADSTESESSKSEAIDQALGKLQSKDRDVLMLRYFEDLSFREIGRRLGKSEDASQKHAERSLKRLGEIVHRLHLKLPALTGTILTSHLLQTTEGASSVKEITHRALIAGGASAGASVAAFSTMLWMKPFVSGAAVFLVTLPVIAEWQVHRRLTEELTSLQAQATSQVIVINHQELSSLLPNDRGTSVTAEDQEALEAAALVGQLKRDEQAFRRKYESGIPPATAEDYPEYLAEVDAFFQKSMKVMTDPRVTAVMDKGKTPATHARVLATAMDLTSEKAHRTETLIQERRQTGEESGLKGFKSNLSKPLQESRTKFTEETTAMLESILSKDEMSQWLQMFGDDYLLGSLSLSPTPAQGMHRRQSTGSNEEDTQP